MTRAIEYRLNAFPEQRHCVESLVESCGVALERRVIDLDPTDGHVDAACGAGETSTSIAGDALHRISNVFLNRLEDER